MTSHERLIKKRIAEIEKEISDKTAGYQTAKNNMEASASAAEFYCKQITDLQAAKKKLQKDIQA